MTDPRTKKTTDPLAAFERLAAQARRETAPALDVRTAVRVRLRERSMEEDTAPAAWFTVGACAAAVAVAVLYAPLLSVLLDPMAGLFHISPMLLH